MKETNKLEDIEHNYKYENIMYLKHPMSKNHPRQSNYVRASQFAPFAALNGFNEKIYEEGREVSSQVFLGEDRINDLNEKFNLLINKKYKNKVKITYYVPDKLKKGGIFREKVGYLRMIDLDNKLIIFSDKEKVKIQDIVNVEIINNQ